MKGRNKETNKSRKRKGKTKETNKHNPESDIRKMREGEREEKMCGSLPQ
jgi:hypothetical protein